MRDMLDDVFVTGATGSGKSSSGILPAMFSAGCGGLFLCAKSEDKSFVESVFKLAGRPNDLRFSGPTNRGGDARQGKKGA